MMQAYLQASSTNHVAVAKSPLGALIRRIASDPSNLDRSYCVVYSTCFEAENGALTEFMKAVYDTAGLARRCLRECGSCGL